MYRQVLSKLEKLLGYDHLDTLRTVSNLASILRQAGVYQEAKILAIRAITGRTKLLSATHVLTLQSQNILAKTHEHLGQIQEAETLFRLLIAQHESAHGREYRDAECFLVFQFGLFLKRYGEPEEAAQVLQRAFKLCQASLGREHVLTIQSICELGSIMNKRGKFQEAIDVLLLLIKLSETQLSLRIFNLSWGIRELTKAMVSRSQHRIAEDLLLDCWSRVWNLIQSTYATCSVSMCLGGYYHGWDLRKEAIRWYRTSLYRHQRVLGQSHDDTFYCEISLITACWAAGKPRVAMPKLWNW